MSHIEYELIEWRKANQIHSWFVENIQEGVDDCREYYVEREQLKELLGLCKTVKNNWGNPKKIKSLLSPQEDFFFGFQKIDEYYLEDIEHTIEGLSRILNSKKLDHLEFYYSSSW